MALDTMLMIGIKECDWKPLVTYAERFPVMENWKALTKYRSHILFAVWLVVYLQGISSNSQDIGCRQRCFRPCHGNSINLCDSVLDFLVRDIFRGSLVVVLERILRVWLRDILARSNVRAVPCWRRARRPKNLAQWRQHLERR
jgi:hypothetical protein